MFIPSSLWRAERYTRYNLLVSLYSVYTWYKPQQAKLSNGYQIPDDDVHLIMLDSTQLDTELEVWDLLHHCDKVKGRYPNFMTHKQNLILLQSSNQQTN